MSSPGEAACNTCNPSQLHISLHFPWAAGQVETTLTPVDIGKPIAISPAFHLWESPRMEFIELWRNICINQIKPVLKNLLNANNANNTTMILQYMRCSMILSSHITRCRRPLCALLKRKNSEPLGCLIFKPPDSLEELQYSRGVFLLQCAGTSPKRAHSRTPFCKALKQSPIDDMQMLCLSPLIDTWKAALSVSSVAFLVQNYLLMFSSHMMITFSDIS